MASSGPRAGGGGTAGKRKSSSKGAARLAGHTGEHGPLAGVVHLPGVPLPTRLPPLNSVTLDTPLRRVFEEKYAKNLASARGIETVEDLLWFFPTRFSEVATTFEGLYPGRYLVIAGRIKRAEIKVMRSGRPGQKMLTADVDTEHGPLTIVFFTAHGHADRLREGVCALFQGTVTEFNGRRQIAHPLYDLLEDPRRPPRRSRSTAASSRTIARSRACRPGRWVTAPNCASTPSRWRSPFRRTSGSSTDCRRSPRRCACVTCRTPGPRWGSRDDVSPTTRRWPCRSCWASDGGPPGRVWRCRAPLPRAVCCPASTSGSPSS
ncbi:OB-fold nucleic acid binding domain-containing protein [Mobilicoccus caccae]|uniref:OB-fold nucleic acid binding domain-containing protein n=1 Tax=Mobilicoccus caccae TaxID=1859295 RepID=UPI0024E0DBA1|nr:OB-fold nucleic acid binding domain-containing protein [Mobilicoccus caccae]